MRKRRSRATRRRWIALAFLAAGGLVVLAITFLDLAPGDADARRAFFLERGRSDVGKGRMEEGIIALRRAIQLGPSDAAAHHMLARAYEQKQLLEEALVELERAAQLAPQSIGVQLDLARVSLLLGQPEQAREAAERAIAQSPSHAEARMLHGKAVAALGDLSEGLRSLRAALDLDRESLDIRLALAAVLLTRGDIAEAESVFRAAAEWHTDSLQARLALASFHQLTRRWDEADVAFRSALELAPNDPLANAQQAYHHVLRGRFDLAISGFRRTLELDPTVVEARAHLIDLLIRGGRIQEAASLFDELLLAGIGGLYLRGRLRLARDDSGGAIEDFERVAAQQPDYRFLPHVADLSVLLGRAYARAGEGEKAAAELKKALDAKTEDPRRQLLVADLALALGNHVAAIERSRSVLQDAPDHLGASLLLGRALLGQGELAQAARAFEDASTLAPQEPRAYLGIGLVHRRQGRAQSALAALEKALELDPEALPALAEIASILRSEGQPERAVARCLDQLRHAPRNAELRQLAAEVLLVEGRDDEALEQLTESVALDPDRPEPHLQLGLLYEKRGEVARAKRSYQRVLELAPASGYAANNLAWLYAAADADLEQALALAQLARRQLPKDARVSDTIGWIYYRKGNFGRAIGFFEESVKKAPETPIFHHHLGMAHYKSGDGTAARRSLEHFLNLAPNHSRAPVTRQVLASLRAATEG